nr:hypothetical protein CFP56_48583 [Quercus suber]
MFTARPPDQRLLSSWLSSLLRTFKRSQHITLEISAEKNGGHTSIAFSLYAKMNHQNHKENCGREVSFQDSVEVLCCGPDCMYDIVNEH